MWCKVMFKFTILYVAIDIFFNESTYSVDESSRNVQVMLVLSNPSSTDLTVKVTSKNDTATGELMNIINAND